jgi:hypothetical protein
METNDKSHFSHYTPLYYAQVKCFLRLLTPSSFEQMPEVCLSMLITLRTVPSNYLARRKTVQVVQNKQRT